MSSVSKTNSLVQELCARVEAWLAVQAPRVRDEGVFASIKFTLSAPCADDDGTLILGLRVRETVEDDLDETDGMRVDGERFDLGDTEDES